MEEGRDCGRTERSSFVSRNRRRRRSSPSRSLSRSLVGSLVRSFRNGRARDFISFVDQPRSPACPLRSRSKGERGKEGRVIHAKRCHHLSSAVSRSLPSIPLMGVRSASLLCGPQRWRAVLTNSGCSLLFWIDNPQVFHLFTFVPFITRN